MPEQPRAPSYRHTLNFILFILIGTIVGIAISMGVTDWIVAQNREDIRAELQAHQLGYSRPSPELFYPIDAVPRMPIVTGFETLTVDEVGDKLSDDEMVLAIELNGVARAYPINMMTQPEREVFNDKLGEHSIVATWCHLCYYGAVYNRVVKDQTLTFSVSGKLWEGNLIMIDEETESLWSQMMGESMRGSLQGEQLEQIPSVMTNWGIWKKKHPETTVMLMTRTSNWYFSSIRDRDEGVEIATMEEGHSRTWAVSMLFDHPIVNDEFNKQPVVVVFDPDSFTAIIFRRKLEDLELTFELNENKLVDRETGTEWDPITGKGLSGELVGKRLDRLPSLTSDSAVWSLYHPESTRWSPE